MKFSIVLSVFVLALCGRSAGTFSRLPYLGASLAGNFALTGLIFNVQQAESFSHPFFHRMGPAQTSDESDEDDEDENISSNPPASRKIPPKPPQNAPPINRDQCLAKLLCGMSVSASNKAQTKGDYFKDYANIVNRYFQVFGTEDGSAESIEAYDDYSFEEDEPLPSAPPVKTTTDKFDISLSFSSPLANMDNSTDADKLLKRNRGSGKLSPSARLARAERILAEMSRQGRKPQPSNCQRLTGCSYSYKELRAKLKSGAKESSSAPKVPIRYKTHSPQARPIVSGGSSSSGSAESGEPFLSFRDPNKGDDELEEIFGSHFTASSKPKVQNKAVPPPPPIYIRRTIIKKKKNPNSPATSDDTDSTTIIRLPGTLTAALNKPASISAPAAAPTETPKRRVSYKKPPKKSQIKDNGDDEVEDINQTLPVKLITSGEYNDDSISIYNVDNGYKKDKPVSTTQAPLKPFPVNKKNTDDSDEDEEEDDEDEEDEEDDEENDEEDDDDENKKKKKKSVVVSKIKAKPSIVVEEDAPKDKTYDDEAAAEKEYYGGLSFSDKKVKEIFKTISKPKYTRNQKYQITKKGQIVKSVEEKDKQEDEPEDEEEENDEESEEDDHERSSIQKKEQGKDDIDVPVSSESDVHFPPRNKKISLQGKSKNSRVRVKGKGNKKKHSDESSEEEIKKSNKNIITEIGGRPLAPPKEYTASGVKAPAAPNPSPFKLQFISPYPSKSQTSSSFASSPAGTFGGGAYSDIKPSPAKSALTSHDFLPTNLKTNYDQSGVQGKPDMFSRFTSLSPLSQITNFFRKGNTPNEAGIADSSMPSSPYIKRPVGPESSNYRRPSLNNNKKKMNRISFLF